MYFKFLKLNFHFIAIFLAIFLVLTIFLGANYLKNQLEIIEQNKYSLIASNMKNKTASLISDKQNSTTAITLTLSKNPDLINFFEHTQQAEALNNLSNYLANSTEYKNIWIQLINLEGQSIYRSWDNSKGDSLASIREDVQEVLRTKQSIKSISVGKYTISFKNIVPIFNGKKFIGVVEVITHFNSIANKLVDDNIDSLFIAHKSFHNQLTRAVTKRFIDQYYIANFRPSKSMLEFAEKNKIDNLIAIDNFKIINNNIATSYKIKNNSDSVIGYVLLKYSLNKVDNSDINSFEMLIKLFTFILVCFIIGIVYLLKLYKDSKVTEENLERMQKYEAILEQKVIDKTHELKDLNESLEQRIILEVEKNRKKDLMLQHQSKLAAMGEMIGNIAHQWRQPLSAISVLASGLDIKHEFGILKDGEIKETSNSIISKVNFLSQTIDDFRNFFIKDKVKEVFFVANIIEKTFEIVKATYQSSYIETKFELDYDIKVNGLASELSQVLLNIFNNARDVLKSKDIQEKFVAISLTKLNTSHLRITISDNAGGISEDIMNQIFDPYFTTKHKSQGTGLGLYMSHEIITNHFEGNIYANNISITFNEKNYIGATFYIELEMFN